jgi:hypothetical protein
MRKHFTPLLLLAQLITFQSFAQFPAVDFPENGKNCSPAIWDDKTPWNPAKNGQVQQLSTTNFSNGIYILAIQLDDDTALQSRFVVQH